MIMWKKQKESAVFVSFSRLDTQQPICIPLGLAFCACAKMALLTGDYRFACLIMCSSAWFAPCVFEKYIRANEQYWVSLTSVLGANNIHFQYTHFQCNSWHKNIFSFTFKISESMTYNKNKRVSRCFTQYNLFNMSNMNQCFINWSKGPCDVISIQWCWKSLVSAMDDFQ